MHHLNAADATRREGGEFWQVETRRIPHTLRNDFHEQGFKKLVLQMVAVELESDEVRERSVERQRRRVGALHADELELDEVLAQRVALPRRRPCELLDEFSIVLGIKIEREEREVREHEAFQERRRIRGLDEREAELPHGRELDHVCGPGPVSSRLGAAGRTRRGEREGVQIGRSTQHARKDRVGRAHVLRVIAEFELLQPLQEGACLPVDVHAPQRDLPQLGRAPAERREERLLEVHGVEMIEVFVVFAVAQSQRTELGRRGDRG